MYSPSIVAAELSEVVKIGYTVAWVHSTLLIKFRYTKNFTSICMRSHDNILLWIRVANEKQTI